MTKQNLIGWPDVQVEWIRDRHSPPLLVQPMTPLYHPRPERWPQVSLKGLLILAAFACMAFGSWLAVGHGFGEWIIKVLLALFFGAIGDHAGPRS